MSASFRIRCLFGGFFGFGNGVRATYADKGYGTLWAMLMSAIAFCGSMQFSQ
jgi:predicted branched-subunit amino acid permease